MMPLDGWDRWVRIPLRASMFLSWVGTDFCDKLITVLEDSYRVCLIVCDLATPKQGDLRPVWGVPTHKQKKVA